MTEQKKKTGRKWLCIATAVFSVVWWLLWVGGAMKAFDNRWSDLRLRMPNILASLVRPQGNGYTFLFGKKINRAADPKISIAAIDDYTLSQYGWPVKRRYYGPLIEKLNKLGVKAIGMDVLFFEPDKDNPENDRVMVSEVAKAGDVVNLVAIDPNTRKVQLPIKGLAQASAYLAHPHSDISLDSDGYVRQFYLFYPDRDTNGDGLPDTPFTYKDLKAGPLRCKDCEDKRIPSLGMATYAVYSGKTLFELYARYGQAPLRLNYRYPVERKAHPGWDKDPENQIISSYRHISVADIIQGRLSKEEKEILKGGIVLVGSTALGAYDHVPSPFLPQLPGVEVHATTIDNVMRKDQLQEGDALSMTLAILLLPWLAVFLGRYALRLMVPLSALAMACLLVADIYLRGALYDYPFITVSLAFFIPALCIIVDKGLMEGREKKWIKNTFGQYLSPKVVEIITKDPSKLSLGGEKRDMTAMFADIASFTTISEKLAPEQLTSMLNTYLSGLTDVILQHEGVVDKFIGDCIMAFWNAPLDLKDHRTQACLAAVECLAVNDRLNAAARNLVIKPNFRIGLNSGPMTVGNMGSKNRFSYTAIGDAVNLASRLEGANKFFHSRIMASEDVFVEAKDLVEARYLGQIRVVGKAIPVKVYEPLARKGAAADELLKMLQLFGTGTDNFYAGKYQAAAKDFKAALAARPGDGPSRFYLELAEAYDRQVPGDWDGTFNLTAK
jgi:adenylate cyclase